MVPSATKQQLIKAQRTGKLGVCFIRCKKLVRMFVIATINICVEVVVCTSTANLTALV
jgi:hypothetical protein